MKIAVPKETVRGESRVAVVPDSVKKLIELGCSVTVEKGCGEGSDFSDDDYKSAGATIGAASGNWLSEADIVFRVNPPTAEEIEPLKKGALLISFLDPLNQHDLVNTIARKGVSAISMEFIPRTTLAQKMDALSSQANLAGYVAVILAANRLNKMLPMMMTPAGTIAPSRVFIIGVGVAGLQAIATAKRLGARVEAFDTRPVVEEQVKSLGAKFVKVDLGETGETEEGYARELTKEQLAKQQEEMAKHCAMADVVITTAQVFGRKAPLIVTEEILSRMKAGSIVIDLAVESGGNVAGAVLDKEVTTGNGVLIVGLGRLSSEVATNASQMYSANLFNLVSHFWDKEGGKIKLDTEDEIMNGCLIIHGGEVRNQMIKDSMSK